VIQLGRFGVPSLRRSGVGFLACAYVILRASFLSHRRACSSFSRILRIRSSNKAAALDGPFPPERSIGRARFKERLKKMSSSAPGPWQKLYKSRRWERRSRRNLQSFKYICQECLKAGKTVPATLSHHLREYQPNFSELEFWYGELTALCHDCHFKIHHPGYEITRDFEIDIDASGWPIDPRHPVFNTNVAKREQNNDNE